MLVASASSMLLCACREPAAPTLERRAEPAPFAAEAPVRDAGVERTHNQDQREITARTSDVRQGMDAIPGLRCSISRQGRLSPVGEFGAEDVNGDRVLDVVERVPVLYAQSAGGLIIMPAARRVTLPWARIARGERCVMDDNDARTHALRVCPARPRSYVPARNRAASIEDAQAAALVAVACARAWAVPAEVIRRALESERRSGRFFEGVTLDALATFALQLQPPWTLANPPSRAGAAANR